MKKTKPHDHEPAKKLIVGQTNNIINFPQWRDSLFLLKSESEHTKG